jgi:ABC-2 type transport system permease protein
MFPLLAANLKMIARDRQSLFWALVFPLIFVVVFGLFDLGGGPSAVKLAVIDQADTVLSRAIRERLATVDFLDIDNSYADEQQAREALQDGDLEFVLVMPPDLADVGPGTDEVPLALLYDEAGNATINQVVINALGRFVDEVNIRVSNASRVVVLDTQGLRAKQIEYFDVLLMGLVGMGVMFNSILVLAVKITTYREQKVLRRLLVTPLRIRNFLTAIVLAHLLLAMMQTAVIIAVGVLVFGGQIYGNLFWIFLLVAVGNIIFLNIGFIVAAYAKTPAAASGMGNVVALPMMFFSGTFFPTDFLPSVMPQVVRLLPLTPLLEALRAVSLDSATPWQTPESLALLAGWIVVSSALAIRLFRFN